MRPPPSERPPASYVPEPGVYDEAFDARGLPRPSYAPLFDQLEALSPRAFERRWADGRRALRDDGLAFDAHGEDRREARPFALDPLPHPIGVEEWAHIEQGVAQRARVLDAFLDDVYARRATTVRALVPASAIVTHPSYLRACVGVEVPRRTRLHLYAADLVRGPDGRFVVVADHAQTPPGAGFALENRIVVSRMFPEAFRALRVERLAPFFVSLRRLLTDLAPRHRDNPRVVLLTPGTLSETYLEQAYLAQYLGITLAQGDDLTVRSDGVAMKTLAGLQPVDVLLRRLADDFADPLELRNDSTLGTVGLVSAVREGHVAVCNALGSGLAESAALMPYLEPLAHALLGESLRLPSAPSRHLGDATDPAAVLGEDVVLRAAHSHRVPPVATRDLDETRRAALAAELRARPEAFVAMARLRPSTVPVFEGGQLVPRPFALRVFAVREGDDYHVLPGGLGRLSAATDAALAFADKGGSKDVWRSYQERVTDVTLLRPAEAPVELRRGGVDLPSRVADHLYWLGRYAERLEGIARVVRAALTVRTETSEEQSLETLVPYERILVAAGAVPRRTESAAEWLVAQVSHPEVGLLRPLRENLRRNGSSARDRLSGDTVRVLLSLDAQLGRTEAELDENGALARTNDLLFACSALSGMSQENMTRGPSHHFFDLGRRIERAVFTSDALRATLPLGEPASRYTLEALLRLADSTITYRSRYLATLQLAPVVDLLLTDVSNPRSIGHQVERIVEHVRGLPDEQRGALPSLGERLSTRLTASVTLADPTELCREGATEPLRALLDTLVTDLEALSDAVVTTYLTHALPSRTFAARAHEEPRG